MADESPTSLVDREGQDDQEEVSPGLLRLHPRGDPGVPLGPGPGLLPCREVLCADWTRSSASAGLLLQSRVFAYVGREASYISNSIRSTISRSEIGACGTFTRSGSRGGVMIPLRARKAPTPAFACQVTAKGDRSS